MACQRKPQRSILYTTQLQYIPGFTQWRGGYDKEVVQDALRQCYVKVSICTVNTDVVILALAADRPNVWTSTNSGLLLPQKRTLGTWQLTIWLWHCDRTSAQRCQFPRLRWCDMSCFMWWEENSMGNTESLRWGLRWGHHGFMHMPLAATPTISTVHDYGSTGAFFCCAVRSNQQPGTCQQGSQASLCSQWQINRGHPINSRSSHCVQALGGDLKTAWRPPSDEERVTGGRVPYTGRAVQIDVLPFYLSRSFTWRFLSLLLKSSKKCFCTE